MKIERIKPIPKYIVNLIKQKDKIDFPQQDGHQRFYSYLAKNDKELVKITCCVKNRYSKWHIKQCAIHGINSNKCFVKDMIFRQISGYQVGWYCEGLNRIKQFYEDDEWGWSDDKYFDPYAPIVNKDYILKFPEFKYSAYNLYKYVDILQYLRIYRKYPECEYLLKLGFLDLVGKKQIMELCRKDKGFRKWLGNNKKEISAKRYYTDVIIKSYKKKLDLDRLQDFERDRKSFSKSKDYQYIKSLFSGKLETFFNYVKEQKTNTSSYCDYINACTELNINLTETKNLMPHNFKRWHDIRIDEYRTLLTERDKEKKKELYDKFLSISTKYSSLQRDLKDLYIALIPTSPQDLIEEGETLHHCVGRMNYDQKFIREETLIFFIRNKEKPEIPLVTVEYSLSKKKVLQCYGEYDTKPSEDIENYVYKTWLPYANKKLRKIA